MTANRQTDIPPPALSLSTPAGQLRQWLRFGAVMTVLAAVIGFNLHRTYHNAIRQEESRILTQTRVIARNIESQLAASDAVLQEIVRDINSLRQPTRQEQSRKRLQVLGTSLSGVRTIFYTDGAGTVQASNRPELDGKNFAHRDYYMTPKASGKFDQPYISTPFQSVLGVYMINQKAIFTTVILRLVPLCIRHTGVTF